MKSLDNTIKKMNREILALKTSQPLSSSMRTFYHLMTVTLTDEELQYFEITYVPGTQPIMTRAYCDSSANIVLFSVDGDKQRFCNSRTYNGETDILLLTTRQILGVRRVA